MEKVSKTEEETHTSIASAKGDEKEEQIEVQSVGMIWAVTMCLGAIQEIFIKSKETLDYYKSDPSNYLEITLSAIRALGMVFIIYLLLRVLIDRKFLTGKPGFSRLWPCYIHCLALSPAFLYKLSKLPLDWTQILKVSMQWLLELFSSSIILFVYRIEDETESPILQMKPYVLTKPIETKED